MYRFHPAVNWQKGYPNKQQIVEQIRHVWKLYKLDQHTKFNCKVDKVYQDKQGRWIINDPSNGRFEGLIAAVGTCGAPKMAKIDNAENFKGKIIHSSDLDEYISPNLHGDEIEANVRVQHRRQGQEDGHHRRRRLGH